MHEENRFQRDTELLGQEGALLWARFDEEMDWLHSTQFVQLPARLERRIERQFTRIA